jgi:uncharacterized protein (TIGR03663 family)
MDTAPSPPASAPAPMGRPEASDDFHTFTLRWRRGSLPLVRIGIVALAAFLRIYALDLRPPHFDEGVNGWFLDQMQKTGYYKYDPTNYHGPLHFYVLFVFKFLFGRNLWALRMPIVLMGILTVDWLFRYERFFDRRICAWAALAMAISPGFLYYQRDAIHETWLVYFLVLMFWGLFGLWQDGGRRYLWAVGLALSGMVLTKETYVIHLGCLWVALIGLLALERFWPSRVPILNANEAPPLESDSLRRPLSAPALFSPIAPQRWSWLELAAVAFVGIGAIVLFYSGTGYHWAGLRGLFTAFAPWMHKAKVGEGHDKPFLYWLKVMGRNEPWVAFGLIACFRWVGPRTSDWRLRLLAIYAVVTLLAYSLIPYKTPWCIISFAWPFLFIAGAGIVEISESWPSRGSRWIAWLAAAALSIVSAVFAIQLNYFKPTAEKGEDYVYVQTFPDVNRIVDPLLKLAREDPRYYHLKGIILCGSTYPLPWMLGEFDHIGYYSDSLTPANYDADFLLVTQNRVAKAEAGLKVPYFRETVRLRSSLDPLNLYLRASLFGHLFPDRTPDFVPEADPKTLSGHDVMTQ